MPNTYTLITGITGEGNPYIVPATPVASVTFSAIPSTYTDFKIVVSARTSRAAVNDYLQLKFNGVDTNQTLRMIQGSGSAASSNSVALIYSPINGNTTVANSFSSNDIYVPNYATSLQKSVSLDGTYEDNAAAIEARLGAALWANTAAITSIVLTPYYGGNFLQYSSFYLYGIKSS